MLATVTDAYTDKYTREIHRAGDTVELTEERFKELTASGHIRAAQAEAPQKKATPRRRTTKKQ